VNQLPNEEDRIIHERLLKLEITLEQLKQGRQTDNEVVEDLQEALDNMQNLLNQVRWILIGAGGMLLIKNFGLTVVIQKLLGMAV